MESRSISVVRKRAKESLKRYDNDDVDGDDSDDNDEEHSREGSFIHFWILNHNILEMDFRLYEKKLDWFSPQGLWGTRGLVSARRRVPTGRSEKRFQLNVFPRDDHLGDTMIMLEFKLCTPIEMHHFLQHFWEWSSSPSRSPFMNIILHLYGIT